MPKPSRYEKNPAEIIRRYQRGDKEFRNIIIEGGNFSNKRLVGIKFEGATLTKCDFGKSTLKQASFLASNLRGSNFKGANLSKANLSGVDLRGAIMRNVNLSGANLEGANLEGVNLAGSNISGANFNRANLKNANLKNTNPGKLWWKANLDEARSLEGTVLPDGTIFGQAAVTSSE